MPRTIEEVQLPVTARVKKEYPHDHVYCIYALMHNEENPPSTEDLNFSELSEETFMIGKMAFETEREASLALIGVAEGESIANLSSDLGNLKAHINLHVNKLACTGMLPSAYRKEDTLFHSAGIAFSLTMAEKGLARNKLKNSYVIVREKKEDYLEMSPA